MICAKCGEDSEDVQIVRDGSQLCEACAWELHAEEMIELTTEENLAVDSWVDKEVDQIKTGEKC